MKIIRKSIKQVIQNSKEVSINYESLDKFIENFEKTKFTHWFEASPFNIKKLLLKERIAYTFVLDSISFSYWGNPNWKVNYNGKEYNGAKAMMSCIGKATEKGIPLLDPEYLSTIEKETLDEILEGTVQIPLFEERRNILQEIGKKTIEYGGYENIIRMGKNDAAELTEVIVKIFPSFDDHSIYNYKKVFFYKRAQLLTADLAHMLEGTNLEINHLEKLTGCADYKLPQIFQKEGIFQYSEKLDYKINNKIELSLNSNEVTEIRANTIHVVDLIAEKIRATANEINDYIWMLGQEKSYCDKPYMRVRTTAF